MSELPFKSHPAADIWPIMPDDEIDALANDMKVNGQRMPIYEDVQGRIVDGRNRYLACLRAGIEPKIESYWPNDHGPVEAFITSLNQQRRHMTREQRNEVMQKMRDAGRSTHEIAEAVGVDQSTVVRNTTVPSDANASVSTEEAIHDPGSETPEQPTAKKYVPKLRPPLRKPQAKRLSDEEKDRIKASDKPVRQIAKENGVAVSTVQEVKKATSQSVIDRRIGVIRDFRDGYRLNDIVETNKVSKDSAIRLLKEEGKSLTVADILYIYSQHLINNHLSNESMEFLSKVFGRLHRIYWSIATSHCDHYDDSSPTTSLDESFQQIRDAAICLLRAMARTVDHLESIDEETRNQWLDSYSEQANVTLDMLAGINQYYSDHPSEKSEGTE